MMDSERGRPAHHPIQVRRLSGVARPLDFGYPSNRWIAVVAAATFVAVLLWQGLVGGEGAVDGLLAAAATAARTALAVFLAWAFCRELDPDRPRAAMASALLALGGLAIVGLPSIAACFLVLLAIRVLNRTTGVPATVLDAVVLLGLGVWLGLDRGWPYPATAVAAVLGDALLPPHRPRRILLALAGAAVTFGLLYLLGDLVARRQAPVAPAAGAVAVLGALLFLPTLRAVSDLASIADTTGRPLLTARVRAGQALALVLGVVAALGRGFAGLTELTPLGAAVIAAGVLRWPPRSHAPTPRAAGESDRDSGHRQVESGRR